MTSLSSSRRSSSTSSAGTPGNSPFTLRSMSIQEDSAKEFEPSSVFNDACYEIPFCTSNDNNAEMIIVGPDAEDKHGGRVKYKENNRSDSGICDVHDQ